jgi:hypothetical protein
MLYTENIRFTYGGGISNGDGYSKCTGYGCANQSNNLTENAKGYGSGFDSSPGYSNMKGIGAGIANASGLRNCSGSSQDF